MGFENLLTPRRVGVDLDEVTVHMCGPFLDKIFNPLYGTTLDQSFWLSCRFEDVINSFQYCKDEMVLSLGKSFHGSPDPALFNGKMLFEDFSSILKSNSDSSFLENLPPVYGAIDTIHKLEEDGFDINYLTFRSELFYRDPISRTKYWLKKHNLNSDKVFFSQDKYSHMDKLGLDVMIEDMPHTALDISLNGKDVLLFSYPWNSFSQNDRFLDKSIRDEKHALISEVDSQDSIIRVSNWQEIYHRLHNRRANLFLTDSPIDFTNFLFYSSDSDFVKSSLYSFFNVSSNSSFMSDWDRIFLSPSNSDVSSLVKHFENKSEIIYLKSPEGINDYL